MTFKPGCAEKFLEIFNANRHLIRSFKGCSRLELLHSEKEPHVFTTYSIWDKAESLEAYRNSELFQKVWERVKPMFAARPEARSVVIGEK